MLWLTRLIGRLFLVLVFVMGGMVPPGVSSAVESVRGDNFLLAGVRLMEGGKIGYYWRGDDNGSIPEERAKKILSYFYSALAIPNRNWWVNLFILNTGDEVMGPGLEWTELGYTMLDADLRMKIRVNELMSPENNVGERLWDKLEDMGIEGIHPRFWMVPGEVRAYVDRNGIYIRLAKIRVKVEIEDEDLSEVVKERVKGILEDTIVPVIENEINTGQEFRDLRKAYYSMLLAAWIKEKIKTGEIEGRLRRIVDSYNLPDVGLVRVDRWDFLREFGRHYLFDEVGGGFLLVKGGGEDFTGIEIPKNSNEGVPPTENNGIRQNYSKIPDVEINGVRNSLPNRAREFGLNPKRGIGIFGENIEFKIPPNEAIGLNVVIVNDSSKKLVIDKEFVDKYGTSIRFYKKGEKILANIIIFMDKDEKMYVQFIPSNELRTFEEGNEDVAFLGTPVKVSAIIDGLRKGNDIEKVGLFISQRPGEEVTETDREKIKDFMGFDCDFLPENSGFSSTQVRKGKIHLTVGPIRRIIENGEVPKWAGCDECNEKNYLTEKEKGKMEIMKRMMEYQNQVVERIIELVKEIIKIEKEETKSGTQKDIMSLYWDAIRLVLEDEYPLPKEGVNVFLDEEGRKEVRNFIERLLKQDLSTITVQEIKNVLENIKSNERSVEAIREILSVVEKEKKILNKIESMLETEEPAGDSVERINTFLNILKKTDLEKEDFTKLGKLGMSEKDIKEMRKAFNEVRNRGVILERLEKVLSEEKSSPEVKVERIRKIIEVVGKEEKTLEKVKEILIKAENDAEAVSDINWTLSKASEGSTIPYLMDLKFRLGGPFPSFSSNNEELSVKKPIDDLKLYLKNALEELKKIKNNPNPRYDGVRQNIPDIEVVVKMALFLSMLMEEYVGGTFVPSEKEREILVREITSYINVIQKGESKSGDVEEAERGIEDLLDKGIPRVMDEPLNAYGIDLLGRRLLELINEEKMSDNHPEVINGLVRLRSEVLLKYAKSMLEEKYFKDYPLISSQKDLSKQVEEGRKNLKEMIADNIKSLSGIDKFESPEDLQRKLDIFWKRLLEEGINKKLEPEDREELKRIRSSREPKELPKLNAFLEKIEKKYTKISDLKTFLYLKEMELAYYDLMSVFDEIKKKIDKGEINPNTPKKGIRIAYMPLTADPLHLAHLWMIAKVLSTGKVDKVIVVLNNNGVDPRKQDMTDSVLRIAVTDLLLKRIFGDLVEVSTLPIAKEDMLEKTGEEMIKDLVAHFREKEWKVKEFYYLVGSDHAKILNMGVIKKKQEEIDKEDRKVDYEKIREILNRIGELGVKIGFNERLGLIEVENRSFPERGPSDELRLCTDTDKKGSSLLDSLVKAFGEDNAPKIQKFLESCGEEDKELLRKYFLLREELTREEKGKLEVIIGKLKEILGGEDLSLSGKDSSNKLVNPGGLLLSEVSLR